MKNRVIITSGLIFALMALVHLSRIFYPFSIVIDGFTIPVWMSGVFFILLGLLSAWTFAALSSRSDV